MIGPSEPVSGVWLPSLKTLSVSVWSSWDPGGAGCVTVRSSRSDGRRTPTSTGRSTIVSPSTTSGPARSATWWLWTVSRWLRWPWPCASVMEIGAVSPAPKVTVAGAEPAAAWKRGSLEEATTLPSVRMLTTTSAVGALVSASV